MPALTSTADGRGSLQAHVGGAQRAASAADLPARVLPPLPGPDHGQRLPRQLATHAAQGRADHAQRHAGNFLAF